MILEVHDGELPTLCGIYRYIDYKYQAEQHVKEAPGYATRFVLFSEDMSPVCEWHINDKGAFDEVPVTPGTEPDPRSRIPSVASILLDTRIKAGMEPSPVPSIVVKKPGPKS